MKIYKIKFEISGSTMTPFQADTLFGHLCWVIAHTEGDQELESFLEPFKRGNPPFIISDGFPGHLLPKPLTAEFSVDKPEKRKEWKKIDFLDLGDFNSIRRGEKCEPKIAKDLMEVFSVPHNTISRLTNTTLSEGGVYNLKEISVSDITIYVKAASQEWMNRVANLFRELSKSGFGRKKSIGKGQFSVAEVSEFDFPPLKKANGFVTLSNFCPSEGDPTEGLYKTFVKYGKLGEEFTFCGNPFKRPLLMIKAGSVFRTDGEPKEFYGKIVQDGISPPKPEVVQYAYAFAVPILFP
jgi:CRISPR-associated protein Csm4